MMSYHLHIIIYNIIYLHFYIATFKDTIEKNLHNKKQKQKFYTIVDELEFNIQLINWNVHTLG